MASSAGSRTGLLAATVVLAIVAVTSLVFTFIFSAKASRNELALADITAKYNSIVRSNALKGPTVLALTDERKAEGSGFTEADPLLDVAVKQRDDLARLVGGTNPKSALDTAAEALKDAGARVEAFKASPPSATDNMAGTVRSLTNVAVELQNQVVELKKAASDAKAQAAQTVKTTTDQLEANNKQIASIRQELADAQATAQAVSASHQGVVTDSTKTIETQSRTYAESLQDVSTKLADAQRSIQRVQKENQGLSTKLAAFRPDAVQSTIRAADGNVSRISSDGTVYISLGAGQQIVPGMTFEVYDKLGGVPPLATDDISLPVGKGSLEVLRVGPNTSECRVIKRHTGRTITEGDVIANAVYDRNTKFNFVVYGNFDVARTGAATAADAALVKRLITEWGGSVQPDITVSTDFLVIGSEPVIPDFNEEQRRDPVNAKILSDKQTELDNYYATLAKAKELYVPVLNQNRFLYYSGYYDQAKR